MPQEIRSRSNSCASSITELSSDGGEPELELPAAPVAPVKTSKRASAAAKATVPDDQLQSTKRRSHRVASQTVKADDAPAASKKPASRKAAAKAAGVDEVEELGGKLKGVSLKAAPKIPKFKPVHTHDGQYFNGLPQIPTIESPQPQVFVWGCGNGGQFGMGTENLGEFSRPQKNTVIEDMMKAGRFGSKGLGLVAVAAGGMASLFIDTKGTVRAPR